jgi:hypothetical protein
MVKEKSMDDVKFQLVDTPEVAINVSLRSLVEEILPLSTDFVRVSNLGSSHLPGYEFGSMMQSLCETVDQLVQDYVPAWSNSTAKPVAARRHLPCENCMCSYNPLCMPCRY